MRSYYTLSDNPHDTVEIECAKCRRHGRLRPRAPACGAFALKPDRRPRTGQGWRHPAHSILTHIRFHGKLMVRSMEILT